LFKDKVNAVSPCYLRKALFSLMISMKLHSNGLKEALKLCGEFSYLYESSDKVLRVK